MLMQAGPTRAQWIRCAAASLVGAAMALPAPGQSTQRVSVGAFGAQSNSHSWQAWISGNGRCVVFESLASNLVPDDTNGVQDVFVHDRWLNRTVRVSVSSAGEQGNGESARPTISHDGRTVAFYSAADNLVPGDTNGAKDIFVHDLDTGVTERVSVSSAGEEANGRSIHPAISGDGNSIVFHSEATNLAPDGNPQWDVFVHDRDTRLTALASLRTDGGWGNDWSEHPAIAGDGRLVVYHSDADNLIDGDTNGREDVFLYDRWSGVTSRISLRWDGGQANGLCVFPSIAAGGGYVAFESEATNLVPGDTNHVRDIFVRDLANAATVRVSIASDGTEANGDCYSPSISRDGRFVAFSSSADTLVPGDTNGLPDAFIHDLATGETARVSVGYRGVQADGPSTTTTISATGRWIAFQSTARNLVAGDTNLAFDIFVHDLRRPLQPASQRP